MRVLLILMLMCRFSGALAADAFDPVRAQIEKLRMENDIASVAVAVARDGRILWEQGFGWADRENRIPATEHTMYSLASISKPITATGLMVLVQAGKIELDKPINDYLGVAKLRARVGDARDATVRRVANHSSGLPLHYQFFFVDEPYRRPSMDETLLRYGNLVSIPGEHHEYSNLGYGVIDYVIERRSGQPFADFMRQEVFVKLGMTHTSIGIGPGLAQYQAIRYEANGNPLPFYDFDHPGASAVFSSAHDLVRFGMFHLGNRLRDQRSILSDASIQEMQRVTARPDGKADTGHGIAWRVDERADGYRLVSHTGGMPGVATLLNLVPSQNIAVVILSNSGSRVLAPLRDSIMRTLLPKWQDEPEQAPRAPSPPAPMPELTGTWEGELHTYSGVLPLKLECLPDGIVQVRLGEQLTTLLNDARFEGGWLKGRTTGDIGTEDANRHPTYVLRFNLKMRDAQVLNGAITASADRPRSFAVTQWAELKRRQSQANLP